MRPGAFGALGLALLLAGCLVPRGHGSPVPDALPARPGTVIVEGCALDEQQRGALAAPATRAVIGEVVILCLAADASGAVTPPPPATGPALAALLTEVRAAGYGASLAVTLADASGAPPAPAAAAALLADAGFRDALTAALPAATASADAVELALPRLTAAARPGLTALVTALGGSLRPRQALRLWAPPSLTTPSDLPGGDAYDLTALGAHLDAIRLMTVDFSCCGAGPGPTIDAEWAVDVWQHAAHLTTAPLDVTVPLYGTDFGPGGDHWVAYAEAMALATYARVTPHRGAGGTLHFAYQGGAREVWFDDAAATLATLGTWDPARVPLTVGVTYYGLGAEDPAVWDAVAEVTR
jgi:hypothetical protein